MTDDDGGGELGPVRRLPSGSSSDSAESSLAAASSTGTLRGGIGCEACLECPAGWDVDATARCPGWDVALDLLLPRSSSPSGEDESAPVGPTTGTTAAGVFFFFFSRLRVKWSGA